MTQGQFGSLPKPSRSFRLSVSLGLCLRRHPAWSRILQRLEHQLLGKIRALCASPASAGEALFAKITSGTLLSWELLIGWG